MGIRTARLAATLAAALAVIAASCSSDGSGTVRGAVSGDLVALSDVQPQAPETEGATGADGAADRASTSSDASGEAPSENSREVGKPDGDEAAGDADPASYEPFVDPAPLPTDPAVRIGTLDNGLAYYLRRNENPGQSLDLRLIVKVGAVNETEEGAGIAHFIEHMLFNGTEDFPGNSLSEALRDIGVELGPDLNAHVSHDETAFEVVVGTDPPSNVEAVFHALSQMAHAATFRPDAVASERGVVLDEMRGARETSFGHVSAEFDRIYTQGTPYEGRDPIGTRRSVESMSPEDLRAFYETWYVPSNMAVVAVGDWPVAGLEALVEEHFGPIPAGEAPSSAAVAAVPDPGPSTHVVTDAEQGFSYISLDIPIPRHDAGTVGGQRLQTVETLIETMILNRLTDAYYRGELSQVDPPKFESFDYNRGLRYYGTNWQGDDLAAASTDYMSVLLTVREHGFTAVEAARAAEHLRVGLRFRLDTAPTTQDWQYAQLYEDHFLVGADLSAVEARAARISALLDEIGLEELTGHYRWLMDRAGPIFIAVGPDPASVPSIEDLRAALAAASAGPPPVVEADVDALMPPPEPVDEVASGPLPVLDGIEWEFANGVRVMFVESDIAEGIVSLEARSLGGWSRLDPGHRALAARAAEAVLGSGLAGHSRSQINRFLGESTVSLEAFIDETTEGFSGGSGVADVEILFQLLHLLVTGPQIDEPAFWDAVNEAENRTSLAEVHPSWQAWVAYNEARFDEAWHRPVATRRQIETLTAPGLLSVYRRRLGSVDDMVVAVAGDLDTSEIGRLARRYIGTLPAGEQDTYLDRRPPPPEESVRRYIQLDAGESAVIELYHEAPVPVTPHSSVVADVLATALSERLFGVIREELGASYTAVAQIGPTLAPSLGFESHVYATLDPERLEEIHATALAIVDDAAAGGFTAQEFEQAVAIVAADYGKVSNADLIEALASRLHLADDDVATPYRREEELERVTAADVQALAAALYRDGGRIEIISAPLPVPT